jgi:hypothetical protein
MAIEPTKGGIEKNIFFPLLLWVTVEKTVGSAVHVLVSMMGLRREL